MPLNNLEKQLLQAQDTKTRELTLKEVGEWLLRCRLNNASLEMMWNDIEALRRGEMPDSKGKEAADVGT